MNLFSSAHPEPIRKWSERMDTNQRSGIAHGRQIPYVARMENQSPGTQKIFISAQYFLYFGVMGIFLPYFNLYCYHIGFSKFQIGLLSSVRSVVVILFALIWSRLADQWQISRPLYILCSFISAGIWAFYLLTVDFSLILIITICYGIFYAPIISFLEAFTMDVLGKEKKKYGRIRVWGTLAFIAVVICVGKLIDLYSMEIILLLVLIGSIVQAFISVAVPGLKTRIHDSLASKGDPLLSKQMIIFLLCAFLMLVSHGAFYGFFSIYLESIGYDKTFIGITWALASISEIFVMVTSNRLFRRYAPEKVLFFSFLVAALRWTLVAFIRSPALIMTAQALHAVTYGTFHMASILYIDKLSPAASKTTGQAVNNAVTYGLGLMIGFLLSGAVYEQMGATALFVISGAIALTGGLIFKISRPAANRL